MGAPYIIEVTSVGGATSYGVLAGAKPADITEALNDPATFSFDLATSDPDVRLLKPKEREVKVTRGGNLVFVGPVWGKSVGTGTVRYECRDLLAYFAQRHIDRGAGRTNKLANPQFESGLTSWTTSANTTSSVDTTRKILGTQSAKLVNAQAGEDAHLLQQVSITAGTVGEFVTLAAWFYVEAAGWVGPALDSRGLYLERISGGTVKAFDFAVIDDETPRGAWQRAEVGIHIPPGATETVGAALFSPGGTIWWDGVSLTLMESLSSYATDAASIAARIVRFAQGTESGFTDVSKSDLLITTNTPASGTLLDRHYQFADHAEVLNALREFADMGILDFWIDTARVFRTSAPRRGTDRSATITLVAESNCILGDPWLDINGDDGVSQVIVLGEGDGPDREEGAASDSSVFGGVTYQRVMTPRQPNVPIDNLSAVAGEELRIAKAPQQVHVTVTDRQLMEVLGLGDTVAMALRDGSEEVVTNHRIIRRRLTPDGDTMPITLVPA